MHVREGFWFSMYDYKDWMTGNGAIRYWFGVGRGTCHFFFLSPLVSFLRLHHRIGKQYNWFIFKRVPESLPRANMSRGRREAILTTCLQWQLAPS
jgi:hypothetical protein